MLDLHLASELVETAHEPRDGLGLVQSIEVIRSEVLLLDAVAEHVVGGGQHGGGDGEDGLLGPAAGLEPQELAAQDEATEFFDRRAISKLTKQLDEDRKSVVEQLKDCAYLHRQVVWLQDRFPKAEMADVLGLCKVVTRADIEAADWSLTPGRFVGVAPAEVDEDFDFEQTLRDIHLELADLNREAVDLALKIQINFEELGV